MTFSTIKNYLSFIKFSHTVFALPFALIGFVLGYQQNADADLFRLLVLVILCMVFARSAAMGFNRYIDARFDKLNPRTARREIPAGIISPSKAFWFVVVMSISFIVATYFVNKLCFLLSPFALFVILFYSYTKRFTPLCHLVLGLGLALAPIGAYLALTGRFDTLPLLFSCVVLLWVSAFDILYALQDEAFDKEHQLKSIPVLLGRKGAMNLSRIMHVVTALFVIGIGIFYMNSIGYWLGASGFIALLIYQHSIISVNDISRINMAFGTTNGIASVWYGVWVIAGVVLKLLK